MSVYKGGPASSLDDMLYILRSEAMLVRPEDMETGYRTFTPLSGNLKRRILRLSRQRNTGI